MTEVRMSAEEIKAEIDYEDSMGSNTLLQNLMALNQEIEIDLDNDSVRVFKVLDADGKMSDYKIRNKDGNDIQL